MGTVYRALDTKLNRPGMIMGTVDYMSPEQASGLAVDARGDVFSFGVVLYELLARRKPFAGATDLEVLKTITHGTPEPLSEEVPAALRSVVEKALEKDPADRYQTMGELVVDLRRASATDCRANLIDARFRGPGRNAPQPVVDAETGAGLGSSCRTGTCRDGLAASTSITVHGSGSADDWVDRGSSLRECEPGHAERVFE